jgi:uncharacterized surface protein with fasciclin (FAS1) repeats
MRKTFLATLAALAIGVGTTGIAQAQSEPTQNIVEIAAGNDDLSTLVAAVTAAELAETLSGPGPFTVFAPTNAAFEKLPAGTVEKLLEDPKGDLTKILQLHVISGEVDSTAAIAAAGTNVETLGGPVAVALDGETLTVGGAKVVTADIKATNGVIHLIDAVITEPAAAEAAAEETATTEAVAEETATTEAAPAEEAAPETPTEVNAGGDGLAADSNRSTAMFFVLAAIAAVGIAGSATAIVRARRKS